MRVFRLEGNKTLVCMGILLVLFVSAASLAGAQSYKLTVLTSDQNGTAPHIDPNLINGWGISFSSTGPFWVSDNGTGVSTIYDATGTPQPLVVTIPPAAGNTKGTPSGTVFNGSTDFVVTQNLMSGAALFLFDSEDGTISGWAPGVNATSAVLAVDNSTTGADYKGMELANNGTGNFLYLCNFFAATIEVYDRTFQKVSLAGNFTDPRLPAGFAPYNIRKLGNRLFVAYAKQNASKHDPVGGLGLGLIDVFDLNGNFVKRFTSRGMLNVPWGLAKAPATFGTFSNNILVGNVNDGRITAFDAVTGAVKGQLSNAQGQAIVLRGLWAITFGNGGQGGAKNVLYFASGPTSYLHGRFGSIAAQ